MFSNELEKDSKVCFWKEYEFNRGDLFLCVWFAHREQGTKIPKILRKNFVKSISRKISWKWFHELFFRFDFELKSSFFTIFLLIEHCVAEELIAIIIYVTSRYNHHQQQHRPKSWFVACYALIPCLWKQNYSVLNQLV